MLVGLRRGGSGSLGRGLKKSFVGLISGVQGLLDAYGQTNGCFSYCVREVNVTGTCLHYNRYIMASQHTRGELRSSVRFPLITCCITNLSRHR